MRSSTSVPLLVACLAFPAAPLLAQDFTGTFTVPNDVGGVMAVSLQQSGNGVTGTLSSNGVTFQIQGQVEDGTLIGTMAGPAGNLFFEADRFENELFVTMYGTDGNGQPNYEDYTELELVAQGANGPAPSTTPGATGGQPSGGGGILGGGAAAADPFAGTFSNGSVVLDLQGSGGQYQGRVSVNGTVYPVSASGGPGGLQGLIQGPQQTFPMTVTPTAGGVLVVEGGTQYDLRRQSDARGGGGGLLGGAPPTTAQANPMPQPGSGQPGAGGQGGGGRSPTGRELAPGFTTQHPIVQQWEAMLAGKKLTRMSSYSSGLSGGYSARTDVYLCSNRQFAMRDESSVSVDVGGAFGNSGGVDNGQGTWYLITNGQVVGLVLEYQNGQADEFRMDYQNGETYANGERVYVTAAEVCY